MAAVQYLRHTAALRALLDMEPDPASNDPAPGYDGPAIWVGAGPGELRVNAGGSALCEPDGGLETPVAAFVGDVRAAKAPRMAVISLEAAGGRVRRFALTGLPQDDGILILARETTKETDHIRTLKASREMFRDVALCAGGLAFETDEKGLFRWVGPGKPLGFSPETMLGRLAKDYLLPQSPQAFDPFSVRELIEDAPVWAQSLDQGPRALRMTVRPVFDGAGVWRGVRGHARDETGDLRQARLERFTQAAVEAMRLAQTPEDLVRSLAAAAANACEVQIAWIFGTAPGPECLASNGLTPCDFVREIAGRTLAEKPQHPALFSAGDWTGLSVALRSHGETQGVLLVASPAAGGTVTRDVHEMLRLIVPLASVAIAQARLMMQTRGLLSLDALTGLNSAYAWRDGLAARLAAGDRGTVIAIECERFKAFGDGLGRAASDELLVEIAGQLRTLQAPGGLCARLDEACFALWCGGADGATAGVMAQAVVEAFRIASRRMSLALAASPVIGAACAEANDSAEGLTQRALQALAAAKRAGKGRGTPQSCSKT